MTWYHPPNVSKTTEDGASVWTLTGDWTRDLPADVSHAAVASLDQEDPPTHLVLDLTDVAFIDSWGEDKICDVIQAALDDDGRVVWVSDPSRSADYSGFRIRLRTRRLTTEERTTRAEAMRELAG